MSLILNPSISVNGFRGGYRPSVNYASLNQADTPDAANVFYTAEEDIEKRHGSERLYNRPLFSSSATSTGRPITGHYFFQKAGTTSSFNIVAAGDSLFNFTSATANAIATALSDNSNTFFSFIQVQDPRSAADDIMLAANGVNAIQAWNGSATAVLLSSFTSATQVPIARFLLHHKERVYAARITDTTDADAAVRVYRTGFGTDGVADPHRFTENFYVGGSDKDGPIEGAKTLGDAIFFYKRNSIWRFSPSVGDTNDLVKLIEGNGLLAPHSLVDVGGMHIFLSEKGVMAFDGAQIQHLSQEIDRELLLNTNLSQLQYSKAVFDRQRSQYILYAPSSGSDRNNTGFVYDLRPKILSWQPPITGRRVSFASSLIGQDNMPHIIYGDYLGFLYQESETARNDGPSTGYNGTATSGSINTLTDSASSFSVTGAGLSGFVLRIIDGTGLGQERVISSNTAEVITVETQWNTAPDATSVYAIGAVDAHFRTPDYHFIGHDISKLFRRMILRTREEGNVPLVVYYIVDFNDLTNATRADLNLYVDGFIWGISRWDRARWGGRPNIRSRISFRSTNAQSMIGTHLALYFYNGRANETFRIRGFDIELYQAGKR